MSFISSFFDYLSQCFFPLPGSVSRAGRRGVCFSVLQCLFGETQSASRMHAPRVAVTSAARLEPRERWRSARDRGGIGHVLPPLLCCLCVVDGVICFHYGYKRAHGENTRTKARKRKRAYTPRQRDCTPPPPPPYARPHLCQRDRKGLCSWRVVCVRAARAGGGGGRGWGWGRILEPGGGTHVL